MDLKLGARMLVKSPGLTIVAVTALAIAIGEYTFNIGVGMLSLRDYDRRLLYSHVELNARLVRLCLLPPTGTFLSWSCVGPGRPCSSSTMVGQPVRRIPGVRDGNGGGT